MPPVTWRWTALTCFTETTWMRCSLCSKTLTAILCGGPHSTKSVNDTQPAARNRQPVINTLINPPGIEDEYLRCLNSCFPGWGDRRTFDWYFRRTTPADLIVFQKDGDTAAGSALTYRRLTLPNG